VLSYLQQKSSAARDVRLAEIGSEKDQAIALVQADPTRTGTWCRA
jgi:hypothetical protein